jgi:predicted SprT family Zn-dependent metalloprotease
MATASEVLRLARDELAKHPQLASWSVSLDNARARGGACHYQKRLLTFSRYVTPAMTDHQARMIVLHEIAHALCGHAAGHGPVWVRTCRSIGGDGNRLYDSGLLDRDAVPALVAPWVGTCPAGHVTHRHRRPVRVQSCGQCGKRFSKRNLIEWAYNGRAVPVSRMDSRYAAEYRRITGAPTPSEWIAAGSGS